MSYVLVDDDADLREAIALAVEAAGRAVHQAADGAED